MNLQKCLEVLPIDLLEFSTFSNIVIMMMIIPLVDLVVVSFTSSVVINAKSQQGKKNIHQDLPEDFNYNL